MSQKASALGELGCKASGRTGPQGEYYNKLSHNVSGQSGPKGEYRKARLTV